MKYFGHPQPLPKRARQRAKAWFGVGIMLLSLAASLPVYDWLTARTYQLDSKALAVVGTAKPELAKKLIFNKTENLYQFNADAKNSTSDSPADIAQQLQQNVTGDTKDKTLYSLDLSPRASEGMTIYDNNSQLSFKMIPKFAMQDGRKVQDRLVYPMNDGAKAVYIIKNNGLKEDIVFPAGSKKDTVDLPYSLVLPDTLRAKLAVDGSLGIYSADPNLFGAISFGSDEDQEKVESARKNAPKDHLVFAIPAPTLVTASGDVGKSRATFTLKNNELTVKAAGLNSIDGAFSIDPSVVVTSTAEFATGNDEGNISFATDEIQRGGASGAALKGASWNTVSSLPAPVGQAGSVAYNGYIYVMGGYNGSVNLSSVYYTQILSDGTLSSWSTAPSLPQVATRLGAVTYNGYLYTMGGYNGSTTMTNVYYSKIGSNGTPGTWSSTTSMPQMRQSIMTVAYRGYVYVMGGNSGSAGYASVIYAAINADGTLGSWTATTSLPVENGNTNAVVYNNYIYCVGGFNGSTVVATVTYARINHDGTIGSWGTTTSLPTALEQASITVYKGYIYEMAGDAGSAGNAIVRYAQINADGTLGSWVATASLPAAHTFTSSVIYNGNIYKIGGITPSYVATVYQNSILPAGANGGWATTTDSPTVTSKGKTYGRYGHTTVAYKGYLYLIGGYQNGAGLAETLYAPINANGTVGTWTATTSLPAARYYHASVVANGYVYVLGGFTTVGTNTVLYAPLSPTGGIGAWTTNTTSFTNIRTSLSAATYNGYVYVMAGYAGATEYNDVQFAPLNANGSVGTWQYTYNSAASGSFVGGYTTGRDSAYTVAMNGYLYIVGGWNGTTNYADTQYAPINANGTIGTWAATTSLTTARHGFVGATNKGCLYAAGGGIGGSDTATGEYACANSNGSLGAWQASPSFTNGREYAGGTISSAGTLYITGGFDGGIVYYSDTQYSTINNGGSSGIGTWLSSTSLPASRYGHTTVASDGYMYVLGGNSGGEVATVLYAPINPGGGLGSWVTTTSFTTGRSGHSSFVYNDNIYIIGGYNGSYLSDVQYAPINSDGSIGSWTATTSLPGARSSHTSVIYNGSVYVIGGNTAAGQLNDVLYATIKGDGTLGSWVTTTSFTTARYGHSSVINNDYLYVIGGLNGGTYLSDIQYAPINADGSIGTWVATASLPNGRYGGSAVVSDGYLYTLGGLDSAGTANSDVQSAPLSADGTVGSWTALYDFGTGSYLHSTIAYNGTLYVLGGYSDFGSALGGVAYTAFKSLPRKSRYSKFIDLGSTTTVSNITYTGNLANGRAAIQFKVAGSNGIFGSWHTATELTGPCGVALSARYLMIDVSLKDTRHSDAYDMSASRSTIQDITVDYGASAGPSGVDPSLRLRGGKYFDVSTGIKPLDTLKTIGTGCA